MSFSLCFEPSCFLMCSHEKDCFAPSQSYKSVVSSILCSCETWTLLANSEKKRKKDSGFQIQVHEDISLCLLLSLTWSARPMTGCGARSAFLWVYRTTTCNCQQTETGMVRACHMPRQPVQNILQETLEGGQCCCWQRKCWMDNIKKWNLLALARTAHKGLLQKRFEEDLCWIVLQTSPPPPATQ